MLPVDQKANRLGALLWTALPLLGIFACLTASIWVNPTAPWTQPLDDAWRSYIGAYPDSAIVHTPLAMFFQRFGETFGILIVAVFFPTLVALTGRWRTAIFMWATFLVGPGLLSQLVKNTVNRPRPAADSTLGLWGPIFPSDHGSFPSGHSMEMAAFVVVALALIPATFKWLRAGWIVLGALLMVGMAWQRTLTNAHWISDTIGGLIAGVGVGLLLWWVFYPWIQRDYRRSSRTK